MALLVRHREEGIMTCAVVLVLLGVMTTIATAATSRKTTATAFVSSPSFVTTQNNNNHHRSLHSHRNPFVCANQLSECRPSGAGGSGSSSSCCLSRFQVLSEAGASGGSGGKALRMSPADDKGEDNKEGADLAAEFFKMAQEKGIGLDSEDLLEEEEEEEADEDDDEEDDDEEVNIPQGAINAFLGYDTGDVGEKLAGNVSLTDDQLYSEVKERVLDTAGGFVEFVKGAKEEGSSDEEGDDDDEEDDEGDLVAAGGGGGEENWIVSDAGPQKYEPPSTVPDPDLTAGEVVMLVLNALLNNDVPEKNRGVEIFFGYSSPGSQVKAEEGLTPSEYADFLREAAEYKVLFDHQGASIDKGDYSFDGKKAFFTARVKTGPGPKDSVSVNFILSTTGVDDDSCWLIDSMLIRPQSMRRRRRR